jgi:uracil-DNA glycosylase
VTPAVFAPQTFAPVTSERELARRVQECDACALHRHRQRAVPGSGPADARLVCVGVAPRQHEDVHGVALAGGPRNVVDHALIAAGIPPGSVRFTNLVRCRPPADRLPTIDEVRTCTGHLRNEIEHVAPEVVVTFGQLATTVVLGREVPIERVAGYRLDILQGVTLIPTYDPIDVVRGLPQAVTSLRRDLATAKAVLDGRMRTGAQFLADLRSRRAADD